MIPFIRSILTWSLVFFVFTLFGCAVSTPVRMDSAQVQGIKRPFHTGQIIALPEGRVLTFEELIKELCSKRLVFVGEMHNNCEHHLLQVQILQALLSHEPGMDTAMEFFQVDQQQALDRYFHGKTDESQFLEEAQWSKKWGFPYRFYRPLIQAARDRNRRLIGINAPREIIKHVARAGLEGLKPGERSQLAENMDLTDPGHLAFVQEIYKMHAHGGLKNFDYFYQAQCAWEETMAENISKHLESQGRKLIVFAGNGHILNRYGIPKRVSRRLPVSMAIVAPYAIGSQKELKKDAADYIWFTG
jgi:uncharacterized iron-regulated protein